MNIKRRQADRENEEKLKIRREQTGEKGGKRGDDGGNKKHRTDKKLQ